VDGFEIGDDLRDFLVRLPGCRSLDGRVHEDHVPEYLIADDCKPEDYPSYLWFRLDGTETEHCLSEQMGRHPDVLTYTLECFATSMSDLKYLSATTRAALEGYHGPMGNANIQDVTVSDVDATYIPRGLFSDTGFFNRSFTLDIRTYPEV
jgi:hypothetical protein